VWHTCVAQATTDWGIYQRDNDLFAGKTGPSCITANGPGITIDRNYRAQPGGVVAYPAVRVGMYPYNRDPGSGLPALESAVNLHLHVTDSGQAIGGWIDDLDIWLARPQTPLKHIREIIIVIRHQNYAPYCDPGHVRIGTRSYRAGSCETGSNGSHWPLIRFIARTQHDRAVINIQDFLRVARRHGWIGKDMVVSSISDGTECWSGCRGLTDSMVVRARS
jgi:hypothetical protein